MLDPGLAEAARESLAKEAKGQLEAGGTLKAENNWGLRGMAYEIQGRTEADYRWYRFEAPTELLESLDHNLKIADGVLRFRVFKVDPEAPTIVPPAGSAPPPRERVPAGAPASAPAAAPAEPAAAVAEPEADAGETAVESEAAPEEPASAESEVTPEEPAVAETEEPAEVPAAAESDESAPEEPAAPAE